MNDAKYSSHNLYKNAEGIEVPSVTTILKILNKPALQKWANFLGFKRQNIDDVLSKSSTIGTLFHEAVECYLQEIYWIPIFENYEEESTIRQYMDNFITFRKQHEITPIFMEKSLHSKKFGGTIDFYGMFDEKKTIIDFKTSKSPYSSYFLQLAAYVIMVEEKGYEVEQVGLICCNTCVKTKFLSREEIEPYIEVFNKLVDFFHLWYDLSIKDGWGKII